MGGEVLLLAFIAMAVLPLLAILRRERRERRERRSRGDVESTEPDVPRPLSVNLAIVLVLGLSLWLAGDALLTAITSPPD